MLQNGRSRGVQTITGDSSASLLRGNLGDLSLKESVVHLKLQKVNSLSVSTKLMMCFIILKVMH